MDFTLDTYRSLLDALKGHGDFALRHDVDLRPDFSLRVAKIEAAAGFTATYYFRSMHFVSHAETIRAIASLGHRVGYHYECLTTTDGDMGQAFEDFRRNLEQLRQLAPVTTACAHGSPRSPWNSEELWKHYDRKALGIDFEPMLDTDFARTLYLTDTGRRWDGYRVAVRDKVPGYQEQWEAQGLSFHRTRDIVCALRDPQHPIHRYSLLVNTHPQRWMPFGLGWLKDAVMQNMKNVVKRLIVCARS